MKIQNALDELEKANHMQYLFYPEAPVAGKAVEVGVGSGSGSAGSSSSDIGNAERHRESQTLPLMQF
jgi:hypothetical protein